jgi:hypothetical protein
MHTTHHAGTTGGNEDIGCTPKRSDSLDTCRQCRKYSTLVHTGRTNGHFCAAARNTAGNECVIARCCYPGPAEIQAKAQTQGGVYRTIEGGRR